jgi:NAD(P)-dependent dehydrogenase (short-subunit alcohol dehydrogenase family)
MIRRTAYAPVALITGAYGVIGREIATRIAMEPGWAVVMVGRDRAKIETAADGVRRASGNEHVRAAAADLSRPEDILRLAEDWTGPLHVLVNNASATPSKRTETPEGLEMQFAVNVLGYFRMIRAFEPALALGARALGALALGALAPEALAPEAFAAEAALAAGAGTAVGADTEAPWSRIVNVASFWAGALDLDDLEFKKRRYSNGSAYRQSKQAERMLTAGFACLLRDERIAVNACHPGEVDTPLSNSLGFGGNESPSAGADTPAWLSLEPKLEEVTGKWFEYRRERPCRFMADKESCKKLFDIVESFA